MRKGFIRTLIVFWLLLVGTVATAQAVLNAVDPGPYTATTGFFPLWYQDTHGRGLELCLSTATGTNGPMCVLLANPGIFDPALPIVFPANFPDESFWFSADGAVTGAGVDLRYVAALEAAFGSGVPAENDQISFARIRFFADVPVPGTYTITHPYGVDVFEVTEVTAGREIQFTRDIGIGAPGDFTGALKGDIGPFLVRAAGVVTVGTETFIGDPNVTQTVTGSPFGTNFLRVQGPGIDVQSNQFFLAGKIYPGALASPLVVERTTYARTVAQTQVDVFASSAPTALLSFTPPSPEVLMGGDAFGRFFGQSALLGPNAVPDGVDVTADNAPTNNTAVTIASAVTDVVTITRVEYSGGVLTIEASSSDETSLPTLTYGSQTLAPVGGGPTQSLTVTGLAIPPAAVTVTSDAGGSDTEDVVVLP
jgi:hypothetical protein